MFTCHASSKNKTFRAFVLPVLDYASPVWDPHAQKNILAFGDRRKYLSVTTMYDMLHHHLSLDFSNFFTLSSSPTRSHFLSILCKHFSINSHRFSFSLIVFIFGIVSPIIYFLYPVVLLLSTYYITFYVPYNRINFVLVVFFSCSCFCLLYLSLVFVCVPLCR